MPMRATDSVPGRNHAETMEVRFGKLMWMRMDVLKRMLRLVIFYEQPNGTFYRSVGSNGGQPDSLC